MIGLNRVRAASPAAPYLTATGPGDKIVPKLRRRLGDGNHDFAHTILR